ncbi:MAG TPA: hypothetical protein DCE42_29720, partial [Myxococcales bacterium]|nr:hypothetical protein [Myxococcales bacterium]
MSRGALSHFSLEELDLHIDQASTWQELYQHVTASHITRPMLGTQIWWAQSHNNEERCLKEFFIADPQTYYRQLPSPRWHELKQLSHLSGTQRGLSPQRAELYNRLVDGSLKEEIKEQGPAQHFFFRNLFNVYSFEVEALITQFAMRYGCDRLVQTYGWGPLYLPQRPSYRYVIEMERLDELEAPAPGDYLNIVHRLIEMMAAVTQLHSMLVPLYAYPPEIVREMIHTPYVQLTRPFHYDLSPDQFMCRRGQQGAPDKVILIDFNASRMAETEYSDFSWKTIPGKDYYQPPERRAQASSALEEVTFRSNPIYDLYAILVIGLFYLRRQDLQCKRIQDIPRWNDIAYFYQEIQSNQLAEQLYQQISKNKGVQPQALISLMTAAFQSNPQEREDQLQRIPPLNWRGTSDWMLLPKAMDLLARNCMQRQFHVQWLSDRIQIPQSHTPQSISTYMDMPSCHWQAGPFEEGRLHHPDFSPEACFFFQEDNNLPFIKEGQLLPHTTGTLTVYASF